ncbi:hypothetical protein, partial [Paracoccus benzoatiresistens]
MAMKTTIWFAQEITVAWLVLCRDNPANAPQLLRRPASAPPIRSPAMSLDLNQNDLSHVVAADRAHV